MPDKYRIRFHYHRWNETYWPVYDRRIFETPAEAQTALREVKERHNAHYHKGAQCTLFRWKITVLKAA